MVDRVRWQLDAWVNLPRGSDQEITGGIALVRLTPDEVVPDVGRQLGLWGGQSDADRRAARAIARLSTLTSSSAVAVPVWSGGRLPPTGTSGWRGHGRSRRIVTDGVACRHRQRPGGSVARQPPRSLTGHRVRRSAPRRSPRRHGRPVEVSGRGVVSAPPASLCIMHGDESAGWQRGRPQTVTAWAGSGHREDWWEPSRHRRLAQFQMLTGMHSLPMTRRMTRRVTRTAIS